MSVAAHVRKLAGESMVYGLAGAVTRSIGVLLVPLYTRVLTPDEFGIKSLVETLVLLIGLVAVLGLDNSAARWFYASEDEVERKSTIASWLWCQLAASAALTLPLLLLARPLASRLFGPGEGYAAILVLAALAVPLGTFQKVLGSWLRLQRRAWTAAGFFTATSLLTIGATVLLVLVWRWGLTGVFAARLLAGLFPLLAALVLMRGWLSPRHLRRARLGEMLRLGFPLMPAAIAAWMALSLDRWVLSHYRPLAEVGLYSMAATLASCLGLLTGAFDMASGPFALSIFQEKDSGRVFAKVLDLYAWLGCLLCVGLSLFAPALLRVFTTPDYLAAAGCVPFLAFTVLLTSALTIASIGPGIAKQSVPVAKSIFLASALNLGLNLALVPRFGMGGAAFASMLSYLAAVAFLFGASQRVYPIPYRFRTAAACFAYSWALVALDRLLPPWSGIAMIARLAMCLSFLPLALALGIVRRDHLSLAMVRQ